MFASTLRNVTARRAAVPFRAFSSTHYAQVQDPKKPMSERHAVHKATKDMEGGLDNQSAGVQSAMHQADHGKPNRGEPFDTAAEDKGGKAAFSDAKNEAIKDASSANQEAQVGSFKDHRGGVQDSSNKSSGSVGGKEEAAAPSFLASAKNALGLGTSKKEHEDNKTAGGGSYRGLHTSARRLADKGDATDAAPKDGTGARTPVDGGVVGDQNPHLKHKRPEEVDGGKGNAGETPHLPSKSGAVRAATDQHSDQESQQKARFSTSARQLAAKPPGGYADATVPEPGQDGYPVPGQAYPSAELHAKPPPPNPDMAPASELPRSSTGQGPAHPVTTRQAKEGSLPARNPPPDAKAGQLGLDQAWKDRTAQVDN